MKYNRKLWIQINNTLRERDIDPSQSKFINVVRHHVSETELHFLAKAKFCFSLYKSDTPYLCEAITKDHLRKYDILNLVDNQIVEIETSKKNIKKDGSITIFVKKHKDEIKNTDSDRI